jgi:predicted DNA-binding protein
MTTKKTNKENAKTRYDAKKPTISFRVSLEEYERLDALRENGMSFRTMVLKGAGMIEKDRELKKKEEEERAAEVLRLEEKAWFDALRNVWLWKCPKCGMPVFWDLNLPDQKRQLVQAIRDRDYCHTRCP